MKDTTLFQRGSDLYEKDDIGMYYCGKRVKTAHHTYGPEIRHYYLFVLVNHGTATFYHKNGVIRLKEHDLLVMCPGEKIHYVADTEWSIQWVGLYGKTVERYMQMLAVDGDHPLIHLHKYYEMQQLLEELYQLTGERYEHARCRQMALTYQFFSLLFENQKIKTTPDIAESAKKMMDYNFDKGISVKDISTMLYVSCEHLIRQFAARYTVSPKEYLIEKRMELAKKLLLLDDTSIIEIAHSVGYDDPLYFSRIFKRKVGLSPQHYRKQARSL